MSRVVAVVVLLALVLIGVGIAVSLMMRTRVTAERARCEEHLRRVGFGMFHAALPEEPLPKEPKRFFPAGTVDNPSLPPERRLSWYALALVAIEQGPAEPAGERPKAPPTLTEALASLRPDVAWDEPPNAKAVETRVVSLLCPARPVSWPPGSPALTQYVGLAGLGEDVAALSRDRAGKRAGVFRYDEQTPVDAVADGLSQTIAVAETNSDLGPWAQGGPATVRGLNVEQAPYLGVGRPFAGTHPGGGYFAYADGSVRFIADRIDPAVFRAQLTIAGGEGAEFDAP